MRTVRIILLIALTMVVVLPGPAAAGVSVAQQSYIKEQGPVQRSGFWGSPATISDAQILSIGYITCDYHKQGLSDVEVLTRMVGYRPPTGSRAYTMGLDGVRDAIRYLC